MLDVTHDDPSGPDARPGGEEPEMTPIPPADGVAARVRARRDHLLALWSAGRMGLSADQASAYAGAVVAIGAAGAGDRGLIARIGEDLRATGEPVGDAQIVAQMNHCARIAALEFGVPTGYAADAA